MQKNIEILAPAGGMDALVAAVRCGADAVYLGAGKFNARRGAENFSEKELREAVEYCHIRGVKVYLTLNTLVSDAEIPIALELIACVCALGVDALIIQDMGILNLVKQVAPDMPCHASTQMSVTDVEGFKKLEKLGFKRAVLPRELTFEEIKMIKENTTIELEMFIHGALCMCVSGQCYLSSMLGGRSGNRGLCAQPCRLPFTAPGGTGYDLSLRDLSLIDHIEELRELGIASLKIEGRMKRPEYVAAAVTACRNPSDRRTREDLKAVFSRTGFTDGYFKNDRGIKMFGTRRHEDVTAASPVLKELTHLYDKEPQRIGVSFEVVAEKNKPLHISATANGVTAIYASHHNVEEAINHPITKETIEEQLHKTGGTPFKAKEINITLDENVNLPLSEINSVRRNVLESLEKKLGTGNIKTTIFEETGEIIDDYCENRLLSMSIHKTSWHKAGKASPAYVARFSSPEQIPDNLADFTEGDRRISSMIVPLLSSEGSFDVLQRYGIPFGVELPRAIYGDTTVLRDKLQIAKNEGASFAFAGTLDGVLLAKEVGLPVMGGPTLNAYNSFALQEWKKQGLHSIIVSTELELLKIKNLKGDLPRGILAYGRTPLMLTRNCPVKNGRRCPSCNEQLYLIDRKGIKFPITCKPNGGNASEMLNSRPINLSDKQSELTCADFLFLYFTVEDKGIIEKVIKSFISDSAPFEEFTRGLYYRGVE